MNPFRQLVQRAGRQPPIGTWVMTASPLVAEAIGHAGFDWGVVDMEHSPLDLGMVVSLRIRDRHARPRISFADPRSRTVHGAVHRAGGSPAAPARAGAELHLNRA